MYTATGLASLDIASRRLEAALRILVSQGLTSNECRKTALRVEVHSCELDCPGYRSYVYLVCIEKKLPVYWLRRV